MIEQTFCDSCLRTNDAQPAGRPRRAPRPSSPAEATSRERRVSASFLDPLPFFTPSPHSPAPAVTAPSSARVGMCAAFMAAFTCAMDTSSRWKMPAARAAEACVAANTSAKCCARPAPDEAMTGTATHWATASTRTASKPSPRPGARAGRRRVGGRGSQCHRHPQRRVAGARARAVLVDAVEQDLARAQGDGGDGALLGADVAPLPSPRDRALVPAQRLPRRARPRGGQHRVARVGGGGHVDAARVDGHNHRLGAVAGADLLNRRPPAPHPARRVVRLRRRHRVGADGHLVGAGAEVGGGDVDGGVGRAGGVNQRPDAAAHRQRHEHGRAAPPGGKGSGRVRVRVRGVGEVDRVGRRAIATRARAWQRAAAPAWARPPAAPPGSR